MVLEGFVVIFGCVKYIIIYILMLVLFIFCRWVLVVIYIFVIMLGVIYDF